MLFVALDRPRGTAAQETLQARKRDGHCKPNGIATKRRDACVSAPHGEHTGRRDNAVTGARSTHATSRRGTNAGNSNKTHLQVQIASRVHASGAGSSPRPKRRRAVCRRVQPRSTAGHTRARRTEPSRSPPTNAVDAYKYRLPPAPVAPDGGKTDTTSVPTQQQQRLISATTAPGRRQPQSRCPRPTTAVTIVRDRAAGWRERDAHRRRSARGEASHLSPTGWEPDSRVGFVACAAAAVPLPPALRCAIHSPL